MTRDIRVLVIGNADLMRDGLCAMLRTERGMDVVGAIEVSAAVVASAEAPTPDVAVTVLSIASHRGLDAVAAVRNRWPGVHIAILTMAKGRPLIDDATRAGVDSHILESDTRATLMSAIRSIFEGRRYLSRASSIQVGADNSAATHRSAQPRTGIETLTERERQVMKLIASGYRTREIAHQLSLSHKTIEKYRGSLMHKLGLRSATAVAAYATAHGYLLL
jgi:DNA-binding NarL/FixJ family response regulator